MENNIEKINMLSQAEKDALLVQLLDKQQKEDIRKKAAMKRANEVRKNDEAKRKIHNKHTNAANKRKYRENPEYREKLKEARRTRYWNSKRQKELEDIQVRLSDIEVSDEA